MGLRLSGRILHALLSITIQHSLAIHSSIMDESIPDKCSQVKHYGFNDESTSVAPTG